MNRVWLFLTCTFMFIIMIQVAGDNLPATDPFDDARPDTPQDLRGYGVRQIALLKLRHVAKRNGPYDVGLFGNSRILAMRGADLELNGCSVFNYALSGQSFRSSVRLLERLADVKRLPRNAIISVDHFELQVAGNPIWIGWRQRLGAVINDVEGIFGWRRADLRHRLRIVWRYIWTETLVFRRHFEVSYFRRAVVDAFALNDTPFRAVSAGQRGYLKDGSNPDASPKLEKFGVLPRNTSQIIEAVFRDDLERLFTLAQRNDLKLFLYESPLHPASNDVYAKAPSPFARDARRNMRQVCSKYGVTCKSVPATIFHGGAKWTDATHPPGASLGRWVGDVLRPTLRGCLQ
jgi:hypothetical protein